jgi:hypothetical protein
MKPCNEPRIDCYPDADFDGLNGYEDSQDPYCARSGTGYIILAFNCPVLWRSKLQMEIALSTMEAEYVALIAACKDFFPSIDLVKALCSVVGLSEEFFRGKCWRSHIGKARAGLYDSTKQTLLLEVPLVPNPCL